MNLIGDVRHALRLLARSQLFTMTAVVSLAGGLAATSAVYGVADALLAPAPGVVDAGRVVDIGRGERGQGFDNMSHPAFEYLRQHATTLTGMASVEFGGRPLSLTVADSSERVFGTLVSANFFTVLGTQAALGRFFRADEDEVPGQRPVVVLTHRFWTRRLGADPRVLERPLRLNNRDFAVIGVAEPGFEGVALAGTDVWLPMAMVAEAHGLTDASLLTSPRAVWHVGVGRLAPGIGRPQAQAELNTLMDQYKAATADANPRHTVALLPTSRVPGPMRTPFLVFIGALFALSGSLLAIACSNVAGMLLARASTRRREMATRSAVGASRGRLVAQLLTETAVLFAIAVVVAVPLTFAAVRLLNASVPALPVALNLAVQVNGRVLAFAAVLALAAAITFGLAPARHALGGDLAPLLHGGASTADRRRLWVRHGLVVAQVALSLMLVVTAGLFARSLQQAARTDPGFDTEHIVLANVDVALSGYRGPTAAALVQRFEERLRGVEGVTAVAAARMIPLQGSGFGLGRIRVPGLTGPDDDVVPADWNVVTPDYFTTIGMPLTAGRGFRASDRGDSTPVAIVNEAFARRAWPGRSAVGRRFLHRDRGEHETEVEIVGVAADAKYRYITDASVPFVYVPMAQQPVGDVTFYVRHAPGRSPASAIRPALAQVEPSVAVMFVQPLDEAVALGLLPQRLTAWMAGVVGLAGVALAALGLYGLMAYVVTQRTREFAIRVALGASVSDLRRTVGGMVARLVVMGVALGGSLATGVALALRGLLVGVGTLDPVSYGGAALLCAAALAAASWGPASRAVATDPALALRTE